MPSVTITYIYRGPIEIPWPKNGKPSYTWTNGWSEYKGKEVVYPWMRKCDCRADARSRGAMAKFIREEP